MYILSSAFWPRIVFWDDATWVEIISFAKIDQKTDRSWDIGWEFKLQKK